MLAAIAVLLCILNYTPNTWLSGWDTLHPEFNFLLNVKRLFFGVWHEELGLGALTGHSQIADLPRVLFLCISSFILPLNFLRYFYLFLCLVAGPLGVYFFLSKVVFSQDKNNFLWSFLGGLFYLLNLGTLQHFYVPFEMFNCLYAFLPWLLLFSTRFLQKGEKKDLFIFSILTIFASPMAYASTLWFAYFAFFTLFCASFFLFGQRKKIVFKKCLLLLFLSVLLNTYWLFPNLYFSFSSANLVTEAKSNLMFSEKAFTLDSKYANFQNVPVFKSFLFDWQKFNSDNFEPLLKNWIAHLSNLWVLMTGYFLSFIVLLGIVLSVKKKQKFGLILLPGLFFALFFLLHGIPVLRDIFGFLRERIDIFKEGLRFPWTKFSIFAMFCFSVFFSFGLQSLFSKLKDKKIVFLLLPIFMFLLTVWMWPAFKGDLISPLIRIDIPDQYFEMYSWMNQPENKGRIAILPTAGYAGWDYYRFGYEGAGFIWFGLNRPVLVRDFDRWNPANENFYWELLSATDSKNDELFENVFEKYNVSWIMLDGNIISPAWPMSLNYKKTEKFISDSSKFELVAEFGKIKIYRVNLETPVKDFVYSGNDLPVVNGYDWGNYDRAYDEFGNYISAELDAKRYTLNTFYPFRSLFTGRKADELNIEIEDSGDKIVFKEKLPEGLEDYLVELPKDYSGRELVEINPVTLDSQYFIPAIDSDGKTISVSFPKIKGLLSFESNENLSDFYLPNLSHMYSYLISVQSKNISGKPLLFWLENLTNRKADLEAYLSKELDAERYILNADYFIQPPMAEDGLGYTLHFDNISIGKQKTVNELKKVTVYPIPYRFLTELKIVQKSNIIPPSAGQNQNLNLKTNGITIIHPNPSLYKVQINGEIRSNEILILSQSYHSGWLAFNLDTKRIIKDHFVVNNWSNGWILLANTQPLLPNTYILFFWPQYLQYLGFGFYLIILLFWLRAKSRK